MVIEKAGFDIEASYYQRFDVKLIIPNPQRHDGALQHGGDADGVMDGGFGNLLLGQRCLEGGKQYYDPTTNGLEGRIKERLDHYRQQWEKQAKESGEANQK